MRVVKKPGGSQALTVAIEGLNGSSTRVGWFESAKYNEGTPVAGVAWVQEFGSPKMGIPPRPFFRSTMTNRRQAWAAFSTNAARAVVQGKLAPEGLAEALGLRAEGDVRATITKLSDPPLSQRTIDARRRRSSSGQASTKPLVDTGRLLATLTSQVLKK